MYLAVCDDEREELDRIVSLLDAWRTAHAADPPNALRYRAFQSAMEMLETAQRERYTCYLLDVLMPGVDGLKAAREIRGYDEAAAVVFLSSSPGFAYESYGVQALNYLLKPIQEAQLFALLDDLWRQEQLPQETLLLKTGAAIVRVPYSRICYVEVIRKHVYFHLADGSVREVTGALKDFERTLLARPEFMRIHRSYIANMLYAETLTSSDLRTFRGDSLPVSRTYYPALQKDYMALLFAQGRAERP